MIVISLFIDEINQEWINNVTVYRQYSIYKEKLIISCIRIVRSTEL